MCKIWIQWYKIKKLKPRLNFKCLWIAQKILKYIKILYQLVDSY